MGQETRTSRDLSSLQTLGARLGHDTGVYGLASVGALALGLVSLAVYTRFLPPSIYGSLAAVLFFSALLTVLYGLGWVQGTSRALFKGADEDAISDEQAIDLGGAVGSRGEVLVTAILATTLVAGLGTLVVAATAPQLAELLIGRAAEADAIRWAGALGGVGAIWRVSANVVRLEGRPAMWATVNLVRPIIALAVSIPLLSSGRAEITDVLVGLTAGNAVSLVLTTFVLHVGRPRLPSPSGLATLFALGAALIPVAIAMWTLQNADIFMLSQFATNSDLGLYRAASRIGAVAAYATSAFFLAFGPVRRQAAHADAISEHGPDRTGAVISTGFTVVAVGLLLVLGLGADLFVRLAAPEYADAAPLIPLTAAGALAIGYLRLTYSLANFPRKRRAFIVLCVASAVTFIPLSAIAITAWEGYGAALAVAVAPIVGIVGMAAAARRAGERLLPDAVPLIAVGLLGIGCLAIGLGVRRLAGDPLGPIVEVVALLGFPALVVALRIVPREELAGLWRVFRAAARRSSGAPRAG